MRLTHIMHTLLIHQALGTPETGGGTRHVELPAHLIAQGHKFTILTSNVHYASGRLITDKNGRVRRSQTINGIDIKYLAPFKSLHHSFVLRIVAFLSFMWVSFFAALRVPDVDVVMGTSPPIFQAVSAWLVSVIRHKPFLLEIRDLWPDFAIGMGVLKNPILIMLSRGLERFLYARATHLLVNSPAYRDYLISKGQATDKISFIANGVDLSQFNPEKTNGSAFAAEYELHGKFVVTYAGALGMANDIRTLLDAAAQLRELDALRVLLVGDGKERTNLEAYALKHKLRNVIFCGMRPKADMPGILACTDVCIAILRDIPMFRTTYPNKVFDYMAASKPIVLAINGVIRQVIEASNGGVFVPPGDPTKIAEAIRVLYSTPSDDLARMGTCGRDYVAAHFNRDMHAREFSTLVLRMASL
jgi:glycosyltransferase involved in cell wall biosynthesis